MRRGEVAFGAAFIAFACVVFFLDALISPAEPTQDSTGETAFISTGWYCPSPGGEGVEALMSTANLGRRPIKLRRSSVGDANESALAMASDLPGRRRSQAPLSQFKIPNPVGLTEVFGAGTFTDLQVLANPGGVASSRCSVNPGRRWLFAAGSTTRRQDHFVLVANPFEEEAVVRVRMMGPDKDNVPARLQDVVIPALSQTSLALSEFITETSSFGLEVTATQGRVIVSRYAQVATREGVRGISLDAGVSETSSTWLFAGSEVPAGGGESIVMVNPGAKEALVEITFQTEDEQIAPTQLEEVPVPPGRQVSVKVGDFLPAGTGHSTRVISSNGVAVVAERITMASAGAGKGYESVFGVNKGSTRWVMTTGSTSGGAASMAIMNQGRRGARVAISLLTEKGQTRPEELFGINIPPDRRTSVDLTGFLGGSPVSALVEADPGFIAVEGKLTVGAPYSDFSLTPGQPLG